MPLSTPHKLMIVFAITSLFLLVLYLTTDLIQQAKHQFEITLLNKKAKQVTYYQWTNQHGKMIIGQSKPSNNEDYITFQGSEDIFNNENKIDDELISKGNQYRESLKEESEKRVSSRKSNKNTFAKNATLNAINKTKTCVNLSVQMRDASLSGNTDAHSKLREIHQKTCQ